MLINALQNFILPEDKTFNDAKLENKVTWETKKLVIKAHSKCKVRIRRKHN